MRRLLLGLSATLLIAIAALIVFLLTDTGRSLRDAVSLVLETDELDGGTLASSSDVLAYLQAHPDRYALALWTVGEEDAGLFHDADRSWPLASTVKIIPLALASERIADGRWAPDAPTPEVERFYLRGTDGNAHPEALAKLDGGTSTLANTIHAMIRFSDNAATDTILFRLGRDAGVHPLSGTTLLAIHGFDGGSIDDAAWREAEALGSGPHEVRLPSITEQEAMTRTFDNRGTARDFARLMERLFIDDSSATALARTELQWPMAFDANQRDFETLATKGGSLPGTLTAAYFAKNKKGERRVLALFFHDLPFATWVQLSRSYAQQSLERELLLDDQATERLRVMLAPKPPPP